MTNELTASAIVAKSAVVDEDGVVGGRIGDDTGIDGGGSAAAAAAENKFDSTTVAATAIGAAGAATVVASVGDRPKNDAISGVSTNQLGQSSSARVSVS